MHWLCKVYTYWYFVNDYLLQQDYLAEFCYIENYLEQLYFWNLLYFPESPNKETIMSSSDSLIDCTKPTESTKPYGLCNRHKSVTSKTRSLESGY